MNFTKEIWLVLGLLILFLILFTGPEQQSKGNELIFLSSISPEVRSILQFIIWILTAVYLALSLYM